MLGEGCFAERRTEYKGFSGSLPDRGNGKKEQQNRKLNTYNHDWSLGCVWEDNSR